MAFSAFLSQLSQDAVGSAPMAVRAADTCDALPLLAYRVRDSLRFAHAQQSAPQMTPPGTCHLLRTPIARWGRMVLILPFRLACLHLPS